MREWGRLRRRGRIDVRRSASTAGLGFALLVVVAAPRAPGADTAACTVPVDVEPTRVVAGASGQIAFVSRRSGTFDLYTMDARGGRQRPLVRNRPIAGSVDWSAACRFAFTSWSGNDGDVWMTEPEGNGVRYVARGSNATWSPDGSMLAFHTADPPTVSVVNADGSGRRRLARTSIGDISAPPAWRPDGRELLFVDGDGNLERFSFATGRATFVRNTDADFSWSPDGSRVVLADLEEITSMAPDGEDLHLELERADTWFSSPRPRPDGSLTYIASDPSNAVEALALKTATPRRLFALPAGDPDWLSWSPAGQAVISDKFGVNDVVVVASDGPRRRILRGDAATAPAWSPDRTRIAFATRSGLALLDRRGTLRRLPQAWCAGAISWAPAGKRLVCDTRGGDVLLVDLSRQRPRMRVLLTDEGIGDPSKDSAAWSPDGRSLVYLADGRLDLYHLTRRPGDKAYIPVDLRTVASSPSFSPNGKRVLFAGACDEISPPCRAGIFVVNLDGSGLRRLSRDGANPAWNRTGTKIAFDSLSGGNRDIYVMNADGTHRVRLTTAPRADSDPSWRQG